MIRRLILCTALAAATLTAQGEAQSLGGKIALVSGGITGQGIMAGDICVMDPDGSNIVKLAPVKAGGAGSFTYRIAWSPDGTRLAYKSGKDIYVVDLARKVPVNLTNAGANETNRLPSWSPDGARIAFVSQGSGYSDIYVMNADGSNRVNLTGGQPGVENSMDEAPSWSPDGARIAFASQRGKIKAYNIYVMNADGTNPVQLTSETVRDCVVTTWSPDGARIAFDIWLDKPKSSTGLGYHWEVEVMDADGGNRMPVTQQAGEDKVDNEAPCWSPDGSKILFMSNRRYGHLDVWMVNPDGSEPVRVSQGSSAGESQMFPAWAPVPGLAPVSAVRALSWGEVKAGAW